ncbi:MAG: shikimate dehydrogenase [Actinomycetota bacterium]
MYVGFPVEPGGVAQALAGLRAAGVAGVNVTMPHKLAAAAAMDSLEGEAATIGAVNTVQIVDGRLVGWNTDGAGLASFLTTEGGVTLEGCRVLIIGSGGSARAVIAGLASAGAASLTVLARDAGAAGALAPLAAQASFAVHALGSGEATLVEASDLIVNATPVGQQGEGPLVSLRTLRPDATVVDLIYRPAETLLVKAAAARGARAFGGLGMLVHQAALAFGIFTGQPAPLDALWAGARVERPGPGAP